MVRLNEGLKVALIVLECIRDSDDLKDIEVGVGALMNCREQGLTFYAANKKHKYFTWCVYVHRNSDSIILNGKAGLLSAAGELPYKGDKWECIASFSYDNHLACAENLIKEIKDYCD